METIDCYIKMLDKKGDREGLKQALKAKSEAGKRQGDYKQAKKLESEAQKTFEQYKPRKPQSEDDEIMRYYKLQRQSLGPTKEGFDIEDSLKRQTFEDRSKIEKSLKKLPYRQSSDAQKEIVDKLKNKSYFDRKDKLMEILEDYGEHEDYSAPTKKSIERDYPELDDYQMVKRSSGKNRLPSSELKDKVLRAYDRAKYPDIMESKTDPRIKRAELSEESKVKSLSDYTSGKVDTSDDKKEMDEDEIKEFIRKSRKRTGQ